MKKIVEPHSAAIIILHEIYGLNPFIKALSRDLRKQGFEVICPNLLKRDCFSYAEAQEAYAYFTTEVGFDAYQSIVKLIEQLKKTYMQVFVMGFSVGATIAWRCSETHDCDGIIGFYGSRIRDYLELVPVCPVLLLFADQEAFDVAAVIREVRKKPMVSTQLLLARHGYMDHNSTAYDQNQAQKSWAWISEFFNQSFSPETGFRSASPPLSLCSRLRQCRIPGDDR
jgi:dienelactone hydrolase